VKLGATTETDDLESPERPAVQPVEPISIERVRAALPAFVGTILQKPPVYSAMKLAGRRACDRARDGEQLDLEPRPVRVYAIDLLDYVWPLLKLRIDCGRGTYIRSIARDLGAALGVGGYLTELRRTRIGNYDVSGAATTERLQRDGVLPSLHSIK
jgi:tRNA pseudouridine55 synthase